MEKTSIMDMRNISTLEYKSAQDILIATLPMRYRTPHPARNLRYPPYWEHPETLNSWIKKCIYGKFGFSAAV